jgi:hypothetical protein
MWHFWASFLLDKESLLEFLECGRLGLNHACLCNSDHLDLTMHRAGRAEGEWETHPSGTVDSPAKFTNLLDCQGHPSIHPATNLQNSAGQRFPPKHHLLASSQDELSLTLKVLG